MRHLVAIIPALLLAYALSRTALTQTSLQFIGPLAVILAVHWTVVPKGEGYAARVWRDGAVTSAVLALSVLLVSMLAPMPAQANMGDLTSTVLTVLFCIVIIAVVGAVLAVIGWVVIKLIVLVIRAAFGDRNKPDSRLLDGVSMSAGAVLLAAASVEGIVYGFDPVHEVEVSQTIDAPPGRVWDTMQIATSPAYRLPTILQNFPQPTAVRVDEGTGVGANRVVAFAGREGAGALHLRVTEGSDSHAVFTVQSDTTPFAMWIGFQALSYATTPTADGTELRVALRFERRLAPAVVFDPMMRAAARAAAGVLARDVKARSAG